MVANIQRYTSVDIFIITDERVRVWAPIAFALIIGQ